MNPKVSIVIPVYNSEKYLGILLESIRNQFLMDFEVICVNDGSTDKSLEILEKYSLQDSRFKIISQENGGEGAARNTGLLQATGDYICFFDSDDFIDSDMLSRMVQCAEENEAEIVLCAVDAYHEDSDCFEPNDWAVSKQVVPVNQLFSSIAVDDIFSNVVGYPFNKLYKKDFILRNRLFFQEIRTHGDLSFSYSALAAGRKIVFLDVPFYHHRIREGSLTYTTQDSLWFCLFDALYFLKKELIRLNLWEEFERDFATYALKMAFWKMQRVSNTTKIVIDKALREVWFDKLDLLNHTKTFFYKPFLYDFMQETMSAPYIERKEHYFEQLNNEIFEQEKTIALNKKKIDGIKKSKEYIVGHRILRPFWLLKKKLKSKF